jgi:hypothetical protein
MGYGICFMFGACCDRSITNVVMCIEEWEKGVKNIIDGIRPKLTPVFGNQNCTIIAYNN